MSPSISSDDGEVLAPVHPGEILLEDFMRPMRLTAYRLAEHLRVPRTRIERLTRGQTPVTVDTALRLSRALGTTPEFWLSLQARFDLADSEARVGLLLDDIKPLREVA